MLCCSDVHCDVPEPAAVHALNILRALYRESRLGDQVVPFIPDGITIAIQGFAESFWPVRYLYVRPSYTFESDYLALAYTCSKDT